MTLQEREKRRLGLQAAIDARKALDERRRMGQFATPGVLASSIVRETLPYLKDARRLTVLEPSMGTGAFVSAALSEMGGRVAKIRAYELDDEFHAAAVKLWGRTRCDVRKDDFTTVNPERVADVVFANPPYVRHHALGVERKRRLQSLVQRYAGLRISGLAGLYCHFLLLSRAWMKEGALGAWLIPSEWMSVNYGEALRAFFTRHVKLLRIHRFDVDDVRFDDALVSSCVVWFANLPPDGADVLFTGGRDLEKPMTGRTFRLDELRRVAKWPPRCGCTSEGGLRLGDCFEIRRGIATGDNAFFVLNEDDVRERCIPDDFLKPILPSPRHLKVEHVTADALGIPANADRRFLLDCTGYEMEELPMPVRAYLESGVAVTSHRNLCASRNVWYAQEQREPAPILCSYMGRVSSGGAPVRFILNDSRAIATNSFLMLYPKGPLAEHLGNDVARREELWNLLLEISAEEITQAGRSYGGGLQKIEPRELGNVPCRALAKWMGCGNESSPSRQMELPL